ncbi:MAG: hypothetical protein FWF45_00565 [Coriobacteriia bacterium]|nr:hypothetical protein [Coriobacteriia bacterium]
MAEYTTVKVEVPSKNNETGRWNCDLWIGDDIDGMCMHPDKKHAWCLAGIPDGVPSIPCPLLESRNGLEDFSKSSD